MARSHLLPHAFVWALYIYAAKMLTIHILDIFFMIQLDLNLMRNIGAPSGHKISKTECDGKSKMAATATSWESVFDISSGTFGPFLLIGNPWWPRWAIVIGQHLSCVVCSHQFLQVTFSPKRLRQFQINFTQMFLLCHCTKIAQMVPLHWTSWSPELKTEISPNHFSSLASGQVSKYLHRSVSLMALYENC